MTATPSPTPCTVDSRPDPDQEGDAENAATYPEPPTAFSNGSVAAYVESFERAFLRNDALDREGNVTYLEVYVSDVEVENVTQSGAFVVRLKSYTNGGYLEERGSGTPIQVHWDGAPRRVSYRVTENEVRRAVGSAGGEWPSPAILSQVPAVACPAE
jgi:hypothetical protein